MPFTAHTLPYDATNSFSKIVLGYLKGDPALREFYSFTPDEQGLREAVENRKAFKVDRQTLVSALEQQYADIDSAGPVAANIKALQSVQTFTVCTAHQPNLATGPLYFLYKILHAVRLAQKLQEMYPELHFVPVYYMGSEDADLEELNHFTVQGKRYTWHTTQKGAVGRMKVDAALLQLLTELAGQLDAFPFGKEVCQLLQKHFVKGATVQTATFGLVHELFGALGLVVLIPDAAILKAQMKPVFEAELFAPVASSLVSQTSEKLAAHYNVQAQPREINLFYLEGDIRERIIKTDTGFAVNNTGLSFDETEMMHLLEKHPERFSPNVILRGLFQETILPNIAFIGGGGELAYWLQLKALFLHYGRPFPLLVLRNSFLLLEPKWKDGIAKLGLQIQDCFQNEQQLINGIARKNAQHPLALNGKLEQAEDLFEAIRSQAVLIDPTLSGHVAAIKAGMVKKLVALEQKMLRAEKRKHADTQRQLAAMRNHLFPGDGLQERVDSFLYYYAVYGPAILHELHRHSGALEQQFTVLELDGQA